MLIMSRELNYRTVNDRMQILKNLAQIEQEKIPVLIWQNFGNKRRICRFNIHSIQSDLDSVTLMPFDEKDIDDVREMDYQKTIYFRGQFNNIVFKQDRFYYDALSNKVRFMIPDVVKLIEKRTTQRLLLDSLDKPISAQIEPTSNKKLTTKVFFVKIQNLSLNGIGVILDKKYARLFFADDKVKIYAIGKLEFQKVQFGVIRHITPLAGSSGDVYCGIEFDYPIPPEYLSKFKKSN